MNEHERLGDPAFDRLVAADPARRAPGPVQGVLRAKVDALIAEQTEQGPAAAAEHGSARSGPAEPTSPTESGGSSSPARADELALRRYRRRTPWLVAAAVAGIVVAGGGGYVAGSGSGVMPAADSGAESLAEDAPSVMRAPADPEAEGGAESSEEEPATASGGVEPLDASGNLPTSTGLVFHAGAALSDTPTTAQVRVAGEPGTNLGMYPVVSEVEAVERLGDPRFAGAVLGSSQQDPPAEDAGPPARMLVPGGPLAWPVEDVTIVSAALTEVRYTLSDGSVLLVPAYDLTGDEGGRWTVMAVDEEYLDFLP
jgi:hypothetical protein